MLTTALRSNRYYHPHFTDEEMKLQGDKQGRKAINGGIEVQIQVPDS